MAEEAIIIGAGVSGLTAAARLRRSGHSALVLEKSRGLGGRAATRRWSGLPVDHGAQFFTARSDAFREQVAAWLSRGICREWTRGFHQYAGGRLSQADGDNHPRYACAQGMSALGRALAGDGEARVERMAKATEIRRGSCAWEIACEDGRVFNARALILTCPPPQGAELLGAAAPEASALLRGIGMNPCLAVAASFPRREIGWCGIQCEDAVVSWVGHDTSKRPGLHEGRTVVVVHASAEFSRSRYGAAEEEVIATLLARASEISGEDLRSRQEVFLQRWRYAQPVAAKESPAALLFGEKSPLLLAGECFAGGKIEGAWLSGAAAARQLAGG